MTCKHKRYSVNLAEQDGICLDCKKAGREMFVTNEEAEMASAIEAAARKTVAAFEALGTAQHAGELLMARGNCEKAMVALKGALFNTN